MKAGNIVDVFDGSYSMALIKGVMRHTDGNSLRGRRLRVLAVDGTYPTSRCHSDAGINNTLLVDVDDPDFVLFTQERFCRVVTPALENTARKDTVEIPISRSTRKIVLTLL